MTDFQHDLRGNGEPVRAGAPPDTPAKTPRWVVVAGVVGLVCLVLWAALHHGGFADHGPARHETEHVQP